MGGGYRNHDVCESVTTLTLALFTYGYNYGTKTNTQGNAQLTSLVLKKKISLKVTAYDEKCSWQF